ncbi:hypothetical protein [Kribbella sp. DT2]|uniref:hypothetical protein n=1 Tax=Kribbella sp. DT2 TaxID=3393427 RepID=UPI003CEC7EDA
MTEVKLGMSKHEVTELLGPPLDYMSLGGLLGTTPYSGTLYGGTVRPTGLFGRFRKPKVVPNDQVRLTGGKVTWLYRDVPPGMETLVTLTNGVVTDAFDRPYDPSTRTQPDHEWSRELLPIALTKVEADPTFAQTVRLPGWQRQRSDEVSEFVAGASARSEDNELGRSASRFGELDVIVSYCEDLPITDVRPRYFPHGYLPVLTGLVDGFGIPPRRRDLAHWVLCRSTEGETMAHLVYLPATEQTIVLPWDLMSPEEQSGRTPSS